MTLSVRRSNWLRYQQPNSPSVSCSKIENVPMALHCYVGHKASLWHGTSQLLTVMPSRTYTRQPEKHASNKAAANKIVKYGALSASHICFQWQLRLLPPETSPPYIYRVVDASLQPQRTQERRCSYSSAYPLLVKGEMRSLSWLHLKPCDSLIFMPAALCW